MCVIPFWRLVGVGRRIQLCDLCRPASAVTTGFCYDRFCKFARPEAPLRQSVRSRVGSKSLGTKSAAQLRQSAGRARYHSHECKVRSAFNKHRHRFDFSFLPLLNDGMAEEGGWQTAPMWATRVTPRCTPSGRACSPTRSSTPGPQQECSSRGVSRNI